MKLISISECKTAIVRVPYLLPQTMKLFGLVFKCTLVLFFFFFPPLNSRGVLLETRRDSCLYVKKRVKILALLRFNDHIGLGRTVCSTTQLGCCSRTGQRPFPEFSHRCLVFVVLRVAERLASGDGDALRQAFAEVPVGDVPTEACARAHGGRDGVGPAQAGRHGGLKGQSLHG